MGTAILGSGAAAIRRASDKAGLPRRLAPPRRIPPEDAHPASRPGWNDELERGGARRRLSGRRQARARRRVRRSVPRAGRARTATRRRDRSPCHANGTTAAPALCAWCGRERVADCRRPARRGAGGECAVGAGLAAVLLPWRNGRRSITLSRSGPLTGAAHLSGLAGAARLRRRRSGAHRIRGRRHRGEPAPDHGLPRGAFGPRGRGAPERRGTGARRLCRRPPTRRHQCPDDVPSASRRWQDRQSCRN